MHKRNAMFCLLSAKNVCVCVCVCMCARLYVGCTVVIMHWKSIG
jgi:hypothetical protein